jgi:hypothetical protein
VKLLTIVFAVALLVALGWLFWLLTYPLARWLGVINRKDSIDEDF